MLFGSVKFISLILSIVRTKLTAMILGTQGVGFLGLISATIELIIVFFNAGIPTSLVKYFSISSEEEVPRRLYIARKIVIILSGLGLVFCFAFAGQLSKLTFGTSHYRWAFQLLSLSVFFRILLILFSSYLQGRQYLKKLANAQIIGSVLGVLLTIPLYYLFRMDGVVYNFIAIALIELLVVYLSFRKINQPIEKVDKKFFKTEAKKITKESLYYSLSGMFSVLSVYIVQIYISKNANLSQLGLYVTGNTTINTYVSVVFVAMGMDYFPRITKVANDLQKLSREVNQQLKIGMIILFPVLLGLILLSSWVVPLLFSKDFVSSAFYVDYASIGVFFKMFSWAMSYTLIAQSRNRIFVLNELFFTILFVIISVVGFDYGSLSGLGIGYSIYYILYALAVFIICKFYTKVYAEKNVLSLFLLLSIIIIIAIGIKTFLLHQVLMNVLLVMMVISASIWSLAKIKKIYR